MCRGVGSSVLSHVLEEIFYFLFLQCRRLCILCCTTYTALLCFLPGGFSHLGGTKHRLRVPGLKHMQCRRCFGIVPSLNQEQKGQCQNSHMFWRHSWCAVSTSPCLSGSWGGCWILSQRHIEGGRGNPWICQQLIAGIWGVGGSIELSRYLSSALKVS